MSNDAPRGLQELLTLPPISRRYTDSHKRDTGRQKTYNAEIEFRGKGFDTTYTEADFRKRAKAIFRSQWWRKHYQYALGFDGKPRFLKITIRRGGWGGQAMLHNSEMRFGASATQEIVLLHEMSHFVLMYPTKAARIKFKINGKSKHHGAGYRRVFLDMIGRFIGAEAKKEFKKYMRKHGAKYSMSAKD